MLIRLFDENAQEFYADLLRLDDKSADLLIDGESWSVDRSWLEQAWGMSTPCCALPRVRSRLITPRSSSADLQWLENAEPGFQGAAPQGEQV